MSSRQKANFALALALVLLCLTGITAGSIIVRLYHEQLLVRHTYDVEVAIADLESSLTEVGRSRVAYADSRSPESLRSFADALNKVGPALARIRRLTSDNPEQLVLCDQLDANASERIAPSQRSVELNQKNQSTPERESQLTSQVARAAYDTAQITRRMKLNEQTLLEQRDRRSNALFATILGVLGASFVFSAGMFWLHYFLLNRELEDHKAAENEASRLSMELLRVQDEEQRRFARELHDGVGQTLTAAKLILAVPASRNPGVPWKQQLAALLEEAISQTRTISYLFHPPLLDEIGFSSAARWLVEGYAQRTGLAVSADIPEPEVRLPPGMELALYRVLQEALNNIQRHSMSSRAEIRLRIDPQFVTLVVKDFGKGIPGETLAAFRANGKPTGVGLLSMQERVREQSGELTIGSHAAGTEIVVTIPHHPRHESANSAAAYHA